MSFSMLARRQARSTETGAHPAARIALKAQQSLTRRMRMGIAVANLERAALIRLVDFPLLPLRAGFHHAVKDDHNTRVVKTSLQTGGRAITVAFKQIRRGGFKRLRDIVWPRRLQRSWRVARHLVEHGVPTAEPIALVTPRRHSLKGDSFVVTRWIEGAVDLNLHLGKLGRASHLERIRVRRNTARTLGTLIGRLHRARVSHRDLKPANLLINSRPSSHEVSSQVIDLDGAVISLALTTRTRVKNLARFMSGLRVYSWITKSDRLRFLRAYVAAFREQDTTWKSLWVTLSRKV